MAIPLSYNLRNLAVRRTTTVMTALGIGLTVAVLVAVLSLVEGLSSAFQSSGHPRHVLVMRKGGGSELTSIIQRSQFLEAIKFRPMVERNAQGEPLASPELVQTVNLPSKDAPDGMNLTVRGLMPIGREMREETRLAQGRWFADGRHEAVVGSSVAANGRSSASSTAISLRGTPKSGSMPTRWPPISAASRPSRACSSAPATKSRPRP
jgi:putative ABC transport system permease protein